MRLPGRSALVLIAVGLAAGCGGTLSEPKGPGGVAVLHWTTGRDPTGMGTELVERCNEQHADRWRIEEVVMPPSTDAAREQIIRRLAAGDIALDILSVDVTWTAELAQAGWVVDLSERMEPMRDRYVPAAFGTTEYQGKVWAVPVGTNVALLYYRTDLVKRPPRTWEELVVQAKAVQERRPGTDGFVFQGTQYEGLAVGAMEFMVASGGAMLDEAGTTSRVGDGPALRGLTFMRTLLEEGVSPRAVTTFQEEDARLAFQNGNTVFMRNWPYVYALANDPSSKVAGKFDVTVLPTFEGAGRGVVLGGSNLAISAFSPYPEESWEAIQCLAGEQAQKTRSLRRGELPSLDALYADEEIRAKLPYLLTAREALAGAQPRPVTPYYSEAGRAIYVNANDALAGRITPEEAVKRMDAQLQRAIDGEPEV